MEKQFKHKTPYGIVSETYDTEEKVIRDFTQPRSEEGPRFQSGDEFAKTAALNNRQMHVHLAHTLFL